MTTINEVLKAARKARQLDQEHIARSVSKITGETFSRVALSQIELSKTKCPKAVNLHAICDVLGIDYKEAMKGRIAWLSEQEAALPDGLNEDQRTALALLAKLSPEQRKEWFAWAMRQDEQNQRLKDWLLEQNRKASAR